MSQPSIDTLKKERDGQLAFGRPARGGGLRDVLPVTTVTPESVFRSDGQGGEIEYEREPELPQSFDPYLFVARRKLNAPDGWEWYQLDAWKYRASGDVLVVGGVPSNPVAKPGRKRWAGVKGESCIVTQSEIDAARVEFELSGKCAWCSDGKVLKRWSKDTGCEYRDCGRCAGTGRTTPLSECAPDA